MKRLALVAVTVLIGVLVLGLGAAGAQPDYPPTGHVVAGQSVPAVASPAAANITAAAGDPLPRTGGNSSQLVWAGAGLLVAGAVLVGRGRRRTLRR